MKKMEDSMPEGAPRRLDNPNQSTMEGGQIRTQGGLSYKDTLQRNNLELSFNVIHNAIWDDTPPSEESRDDEPPEVDDPTCPTVPLTALKKR